MRHRRIRMPSCTIPNIIRGRLGFCLACHCRRIGRLTNSLAILLLPIPQRLSKSNLFQDSLVETLLLGNQAS